jgi:hypothetical protein
MRIRVRLLEKCDRRLPFYKLSNSDVIEILNLISKEFNFDEI